MDARSDSLRHTTRLSLAGHAYGHIALGELPQVRHYCWKRERSELQLAFHSITLPEAAIRRLRPSNSAAGATAIARTEMERPAASQPKKGPVNT